MCIYWFRYQGCDLCRSIDDGERCDGVSYGGVTRGVLGRMWIGGCGGFVGASELRMTLWMRRNGCGGGGCGGAFRRQKT